MNHIAQHTPGPWTSEGPDDFGDHNILPTNGDALAIAAVVSNLRPVDEVAANARLVAVAPELLALVAECRKQVDSIIEDGSKVDWRTWRDDLDAVLAKVEAA